MGEVIRFVSRSERERANLIRQARAIYDSIFPPTDLVGEQRDKKAIGHAVGRTKAHRSDEALPS
jgi:hypothetical protein